MRLQGIVPERIRARGGTQTRGFLRVIQELIPGIRTREGLKGPLVPGGAGQPLLTGRQSSEGHMTRGKREKELLRERKTTRGKSDVIVAETSNLGKLHKVVPAEGGSHATQREGESQGKGKSRAPSLSCGPPEEALQTAGSRGGWNPVRGTRVWRSGCRNYF